MAVLSNIPISYIEVSFFAHATEDENKVIEATKNLLPMKNLENIVFDRRNLKGHHGNPIVLFEAKITEKPIMKALVENLSSNLGTVDKETLLEEISLHMEKGNLYLRFDKQVAYMGKPKFGVADPIRIRFRFKKSKPEDIVEICKEIGLLP